MAQHASLSLTWPVDGSRMIDEQARNRRMTCQKGVPRYAALVCFSDDPGEAAANYFILKLMGYPDIKVLVI